MASSATLRDNPSQLIKCTRCQNSRKLLKLLLTHFILRTWENLHHHQPRDANSGENITRVFSATQFSQITGNGIPTNTRFRLTSPRTPRFIQRERQSLALDNYYDCMYKYNHWNPLLLPTFLFTLHLFFHMQTSKPSYKTSSYPNPFLRTLPRNKRTTNVVPQRNVNFATYSLQAN